MASLSLAGPASVASMQPWLSQLLQRCILPDQLLLEELEVAAQVLTGLGTQALVTPAPSGVALPFGVREAAPASCPGSEGCGGPGKMGREMQQLPLRGGF